MLGLPLMQAVCLERQHVHPRYDVAKESLASPILRNDDATHVARAAVSVCIQGIGNFFKRCSWLHNNKLGRRERKARRIEDVGLLEHNTRQRSHGKHCKHFLFTLDTTREWLDHWELINAVGFHDIHCHRASRVSLDSDRPAKIRKLHDRLSHPFVRVLLAITLGHGRFHLVVHDRSGLHVCQCLLDVGDKVCSVLDTTSKSDQAICDTQALSNFQRLIVVAYNSDLLNKSLHTTQRGSNVRNLERINKSCCGIESVL
mmetsp:Transcript_10386/g.34642  ORF Transcript_10386/g.34642 Transcript_10386/m.34642 type:complete len:258 (+) Transcript_10386:209-982(+)